MSTGIKAINDEVQRASAFVRPLFNEIGKVIIGQNYLVERLVVGLLARGARRPRSALRGVLLAFHPLRLTWSGSAALGTLLLYAGLLVLQPLIEDINGRPNDAPNGVASQSDGNQR